MHKKIVYILPFYDERTDTHLFYNYKLIQEARRRGMEILVLSAKTLGLGSLFLKLILARFRDCQDCYVHYSFYGALAAIFSGYKVFYWNRGMPWLFKRSFLEEQVFRFILRQTILVTGPESLAKEYERRYGVKEYRILTNWIDVERFKSKEADPRLSQDFGGQTKTILFVHHLSKRKGADLIIPIAEGLKNEKAEFWVIGDGPEMDNLKSEIRNLKLDKVVKLLGQVPNKEIVKYFHASHVFIMPSREEGSPHVLLEAMAAGTPFVASDVGGVRELAPKALKEFLCPSEDIQCFQEKIRTLLLNQKLYREVREAGFNYAANFDISKGVAEFMELFQ